MTSNYPEDLNQQPQAQQPTPPPYGSPNPYAPSDKKPISPQEERSWATISHLVAGGATVLSVGTLGFLAALGIYLYFKDRGPFVREHAANSLNVQLNMLMWLIISVPLMLVLVGFVTYGLAVLIGVVLHVMGAVKAGNGERWNPPMTIRFVS